MTDIFEKKESNVRSYCRSFPTIFDRALNAELFSGGKRYVDFFAGAGVMNYGHNNPYVKGKILEYLSEDNIIHGLDMFTVAKKNFMEAFEEKVLKPRNLDYKFMFCGPTGTNAVEAALKLVRKNKGRTNVIAFSGAFHGMSMGSIAMTSDLSSRAGVGVPLNNVTFLPYSHTMGDYKKSLEYIQWMLEDDHSGMDKPAAMFLEPIQAEGGINVADIEWLKAIRALCDKHDILMVLDEIQVGVGRAGTYFAFERAGIVPDMVMLAKSLSAFGLPLSLLLMKPELDKFKPGEHNGTFRGNQLGFVGAVAGIDYMIDNDLLGAVNKKAKIIEDFIKENILPIDDRLTYRGVGMIWGIDFAGIDAALSKNVMIKCFEGNLIAERSGSSDSLVKIMPPLTIEEPVLLEGLKILEASIKSVLKK